MTKTTYLIMSRDDIARYQTRVTLTSAGTEPPASFREKCVRRAAAKLMGIRNVESIIELQIEVTP